MVAGVAILMSFSALVPAPDKPTPAVPPAAGATAAATTVASTEGGGAAGTRAGPGGRHGRAGVGRSDGPPPGALEVRHVGEGRGDGIVNGVLGNGDTDRHVDAVAAGNRCGQSRSRHIGGDFRIVVRGDGNTPGMHEAAGTVDRGAGGRG